MMSHFDQSTTLHVHLGDFDSPPIFVASSMHDAARQARARGEQVLANLFYRREFMPAPGDYHVTGDWIVRAS